jgi:hypothetical protein
MKIDFEIQTEHGMYRDSLHFSDTEPLPDNATIEAMKIERVQNWIAVIKMMTESSNTELESRLENG